MLNLRVLEILEIELQRAKGDIIVLSKEIEDLSSTFDGLKVEHASHIDDLMERMMEEQMARAKDKKAAEDNLQSLQKDYEENMMIIQAEGDHKAGELRSEMETKLESVKRSSYDERNEIIRVRAAILQDKEEEITKLEKERRSVKKLLKLARKSISRQMYGQSQKQKDEVERKSRKSTDDQAKMAATLKGLTKEDTVLDRAPAPVFIDAVENDDENVVIELDENFGDEDSSDEDSESNNISSASVDVVKADESSDCPQSTENTVAESKTSDENTVDDPSVLGTVQEEERTEDDVVESPEQDAGVETQAKEEATTEVPTTEEEANLAVKDADVEAITDEVSTEANALVEEEVESEDKADSEEKVEAEDNVEDEDKVEAEDNVEEIAAVTNVTYGLKNGDIVEIKGEQTN